MNSSQSLGGTSKYSYKPPLSKSTVITRSSASYPAMLTLLDSIGTSSPSVPTVEVSVDATTRGSVDTDSASDEQPEIANIAMRASVEAQARLHLIVLLPGGR